MLASTALRALTGSQTPPARNTPSSAVKAAPALPLNTAPWKPGESPRACSPLAIWQVNAPACA